MQRWQIGIASAIATLPRSKRRTTMNIQFDPISWTYPITEVVSVLSDEPGIDLDLSW
jgi:hypothetical protein